MRIYEITHNPHRRRFLKGLGAAAVASQMPGGLGNVLPTPTAAEPAAVAQTAAETDLVADLWSVASRFAQFRGWGFDSTFHDQNGPDDSEEWEFGRNDYVDHPQGRQGYLPFGAPYRIMTSPDGRPFLVAEGDGWTMLTYKANSSDQIYQRGRAGNYRTLVLDNEQDRVTDNDGETVLSHDLQAFNRWLAHDETAHNYNGGDDPDRYYGHYVDYFNATNDMSKDWLQWQERLKPYYEPNDAKSTLKRHGYNLPPGGMIPYDQQVDNDEQPSPDHRVGHALGHGAIDQALRSGSAAALRHLIDLIKHNDQAQPQQQMPAKDMGTVNRVPATPQLPAPHQSVDSIVQQFQQRLGRELTQHELARVRSAVEQKG